MIYLANVAHTLIEFIFGILLLLVVLRVLLQAVHANFYNPICQLIYKATNPFFIPLRRIIPSWGNWDSAGIILAYSLELLKLLLIMLLLGVKLSIAGLIIMAFAELLDFLLMLMLWVIIIRAIFSLVNVDYSHPISPLLYQLTEPLLKPIRHRLPDLQGFDLSPMVAILAIYLARVLVVLPLSDLSHSLR